MSSNKLIVVPAKNSAYKSDGIYIFNKNKNEWIKVLDYDANFECYSQTAAYDKNNDLLYVWKGKDDKLLQFDLKINKLISSSITPICGYSAGLIYIEPKLHQICSSSSNKHYVLNKKLNKFEKIHEFESFHNLEDHGLIYLDSRKCILLFGGGIGWSQYSNSIYEFSILHRKWSKLNAKMPIKLSSFGVVKTRNEGYLIILGGEVDEQEYCDYIFIYDTKKKTFTKSKIKCPAKGRYSATITNDPNRDHVLTFGFVNHCYKSNKFADLQILPFYLIELMSHWVCNQEIHLLQWGTEAHCKINVDAIFGCL